MIEINYDIPGKVELISELKEIFSGVDKVINDLEQEKSVLEKELETLENTKTFTVDNLKRKPEINRLLTENSHLLTQMKKEREELQQSCFTYFPNKVGDIDSQYRQAIEKQLEPVEQEIALLLKQLNEKVMFIKSVKVKANAIYNREIVDEGNKIIGVTRHNRSVIGISSYVSAPNLVERAMKYERGQLKS
ncbi:hypothetical protein ACVWA2_14770 [Enterococcus faecalis]